jgi:hypothetical protein
MTAPVLAILARWVGLAVVLHGLWEIAHLTLYTLWDDPDRVRLVRYVLHCLAGDVLIAVGVYLLTALVFRDFVWPVRRPWTAGSFMFATGLGYTVFSEWYNVYRLGAWAYQSTTPLIAGIGLTLLLQWMVVPALMLFIVRRPHVFRPAAR